MTPDRIYALRHPEGFDDARLGTVRASAEAWVTWLNAVADRADDLLPGLAPPDAPPYALVSCTRSDDRHEVHVGLVGGPGTLGWRKTFEDTFPEPLIRWLPLAFQLELELGRRDTWGFADSWIWTRRMSPEQAEALAAHLGLST